MFEIDDSSSLLSEYKNKLSLSIRSPQDSISTAQENKVNQIEELAKQYKEREIKSLYDVPHSKFEEMEQLHKQGGIELIKAVFPDSPIQDFRYGIPFPNIDPEFRNVEQIAEIYRPIPTTPVENLMEMLQVDKSDSYETFVSKLNSKFKFKELLSDNDYYQTEEGKELISIEIEANLPIAKLKNKKILNFLRSRYRINLNLPGTIGEV